MQLSDQQITEIDTLCATAQAHDGHEALSEHKVLELRSMRRSGFCAALTRDEAGTLVGYAQASKAQESWAIEYVVHPDHRDANHEVARELLTTTKQLIALAGGGDVHLWVKQPDEDDDAIAAEEGFARGPELFQMRRSLPLEAALASRALKTRPFRVGHDEKAWLALNARAFAEHFDQGAWDEQTIADRESQPWFDPEGFLLYEEEGHLLAFCWTKVHKDANGEIGEIYVIGVDPDAQGRGLGKSIVIAGLEHLADRAIPVAMLYVDADSDAAISLYRSLGFAVAFADRAYLARIEPR